MFYQTTFIGLRERGCEGIACPKGVVSPEWLPEICLSAYRSLRRFEASSQMIASCLWVLRFIRCSGIPFSPAA